MAENHFDIDYVAKLARIELTDAERDAFSRQLSSILGHIDALNAVDTSGVTPTAHAFPLENVLGADHVEPSLTPEQALRNAPDQREGYFAVPRVVSES